MACQFVESKIAWNYEKYAFRATDRLSDGDVALNVLMMTVI